MTTTIGIEPNESYLLLYLAEMDIYDQRGLLLYEPKEENDDDDDDEEPHLVRLAYRKLASSPPSHGKPWSGERARGQERNKTNNDSCIWSLGWPAVMIVGPGTSLLFG